MDIQTQHVTNHSHASQELRPRILQQRQKGLSRPQHHNRNHIQHLLQDNTKKIQDIQPFLHKKNIDVRIIPSNMSQEVVIGILTETSMALKHNKDNICAELCSLCKIPITTHSQFTNSNAATDTPPHQQI
jgi:hypothetical protein